MGFELETDEEEVDFLEDEVNNFLFVDWREIRLLLDASKSFEELETLADDADAFLDDSADGC